jgi:RNA polymerase sigma-70 factor (ECF subfamily)
VVTQTEDTVFWELIANERHATWRLCRALTRSYDEAYDLMSDTILAAHKSFPSLRDPGAFHWFISTIAVRIQRRKRWRSRLFVPLEDAAEVSYEMMAESSYDLDQLVTALDRLPTREREALVLFELSGLSIKEIQEIQGGSISGVKSRMSRARRKLRQLIASDNPDWSESLTAAHNHTQNYFDPSTIRLQEL